MAMLNRSFRQMLVVAALLVLGCVQFAAAQEFTASSFTASEQASTLAFLQGIAGVNADLQSLWVGTDFCSWPYVYCYPELSVLDFNMEGSPAVNTTMVLPELSADINAEAVIFVAIRAADFGELLTGSLPNGWGRMTQLQYVYLNNNTFTGSLPESWGSLSAVSQLLLNDNHLMGTLPAAWSGMAAVTNLELANNSLTGSIPSEWAALNLDYITLTGNSLCGCLPVAWADNINFYAVVDPAMAANNCRKVNACPISTSSSAGSDTGAASVECLVPNCVTCSPVNGSVCEECGQNYNLTKDFMCAVVGNAAGGPVSVVATLAAVALALFAVVV